jgi:uncharacterized lipoprotein YddW (UPF0748 family)
LHIDDYFYPYPAPGISIPDNANFAANNYGLRDRGDWRRLNVNLFIEQLYHTVHDAKPWVKVGVSPFGIYRNQRNDPNGSRTNGLQNYDDLYADVLLWDREGWMDYCVPRLYWEVGHKAADYDELIHWWNNHLTNTNLYIGEDVERTVKNADPRNRNQHQLAAKMRLHQEMPRVKGTVLWYAKAAVDNIGNYGMSLRNIYWRTPAFQPAIKQIDSKAPKKPRKVKAFNIDGQRVVFWTAPKGEGWKDMADMYAVYRFAYGEYVDLDDNSHLVAITPNTFYEVPVTEQTPCVYVITSLDRM